MKNKNFQTYYEIYRKKKTRNIFLIISCSLLIAGLGSTTGYLIYKDLNKSEEKTEEKYNIALDANGGSFNDGEQFKVVQNINKDTKFKDLKLVAPHKDKSTFINWSFLGKEIDNETIIHENMSLKAVWSDDPIIIHTVVFNSNGGSEVESQKIKDGEKACFPHSTKKDYELKYWYKDNEKEPFDFNNEIHSNITLFAKWNEISTAKYSVFLDGNGGKFNGEETKEFIDIEKNTLIKDIKNFPKENPTKEGYKFLGYTIDNELININTYIVEKNLFIKAKWEKEETYTVVLNAKDGKFSNNESTLFLNKIKKGTKLKDIKEYETPTSSKTSDVFTYWSIENEPVKDIDNFVINSNVSLIANYDSLLIFTSQEDNSSLSGKITGTLIQPINLKYSLDDGRNWNDFLIGNSGSATTLSGINKGERVCIKNLSDTLSEDEFKNYFSFKMTGKFNCAGNVYALINNAKLTKYCFSYLFSRCDSLLTAPELPEKNLAEGCYENMFSYCSSIKYAPELPSINLEPKCYKYLFESCTSLLNPPKLIANELKEECYADMFSNCSSFENLRNYQLNSSKMVTKCYYEMFKGCTKLTSAPILNSVELAPNCYQSMFKYSAITNYTELPALILKDSCYSYMFSYCTKLVSAPILYGKTLAKECYYSMFSNCSILVKAPTLDVTSLEEKCYMYMFSNCELLIEPPNLPATTLPLNCYSYMFNKCKNLKVNDTGEGTKFFKYPEDALSTSVNLMFAYTGGSITSSLVAGKTYYYSK